MNKHVHRLVFDRRRGMRVPAAEHVRASGKAAGGEGPGAQAAGASASSVLLLSTSLALLASGPAMAQRTMAKSMPRAAHVQAAQQAAGRTINRLPVLSTDPTRTAGNRGSYTVDDPLATGGTVKTITQSDRQVIINWDSFDIAKGYTVRFVQPTNGSALNNIWSNDPSVILGSIQANAEVILQNQNGVIFGPTARIETGRFVATALRLADDAFLNGLRANLKGEAVFGGDEQSNQGFITIERGAEIKALAGGDVIMVAPKVYNEGRIETPSGQTVLAAGKKVYLYSSNGSADSLQRGLIVAVDAFTDTEGAPEGINTVEQAVAGSYKTINGETVSDATPDNTAGLVKKINQVVAERGTINLVGMTVRQNGVLSATTAVKGQNGGIYLQAQKSSYQVDDTKGPRLADELGTVELGSQSITSVTPSASGDTQYSAETFRRSRINIEGKDVRIRSGALVQAVSGNIQVRAAESARTSKLFNTAGNTSRDASSLVVEDGAILTAAGLRNVLLPMSRNQLTASLFQIELADSPVQRGGVAYRQTIAADARRQMRFADVTGYYNLIGRTAQELSTRGGNIMLGSQGTTVVADGAKLNISGGSVKYEAGQLVSSTLSNGQGLVSIEDADPLTRYTALFNPAPADNTLKTTASYVEGADAGHLALLGSTVYLGADVQADAVIGPLQRAGALIGDYVANGSTEPLPAFSDQLGWSKTLKTSPWLYASLRPKGGTLSVGNADEVKALDQIDVVAQSSRTVVEVPEAGTEEAAAIHASLGPTQVSVKSLQAAGLSEVILAAKQVNMAADAKLDLGASGRFEVDAEHGVHLAGEVRGEGGKIILASKGAMTLADSAVLDVSGRQADERGKPGTDAVNVNGGAVSISSGLGSSLDIRGAEIDVSGGYWLSGTGKTKGTAGEITLSVGAAATQAGTRGKLLMDGATLSGYDFASGGKLTLKGMRTLSIGAVPTADQALWADGLQLSADFFSQGGFGSFNLSAVGDVAVMDGTQIVALKKNLFVPLATSKRGAALQGASTPTVQTLEAGLRSGVSVALTASARPNPEAPTEPFPFQQGGRVRIGQDALVDAGAGGRIDLGAGLAIEVEGTLRARGGQVALKLNSADRENNNSDGKPESSTDLIGYVDNQEVRLKGTSQIDVSGIAKVVNSVVGGHQTGSVLGGGSVNLNHTEGTPSRGRVVTEEGSLIDISGATADLNLDSSSQKTRVSQGAGSLMVGSADGFFLQGKLQATRPDASVSGGSFLASLSREGGNDVVNTTKGAQAYPSSQRNIVLLGTTADMADHLKDKGLAYGEGVLSSAQLLDAGFDRITLRSDQLITLGRGAKLVNSKVPLRSVSLTSRELAAGDGAAHAIKAAYVSLGNKDLYQKTQAINAAASVASPGKATLNVDAGLIEVYGYSALKGFEKATLAATLSANQQDDSRTNGEIRFIGGTFGNSTAIAGQFNFDAALTLQAGSIYTTTLSKYTLQGASNKASLTVLAPDGGSTSAAPLSALGSLTLKAHDITIDGSIYQPFGTISIEADHKLSLGGDTMLSVSGEGLVVPVGTMVNGTKWVYSAGSTKNGVPVDSPGTQVLDDLTHGKAITLKGTAELSVDAKATLAAQAGGDLQAWEAVLGVGGSTDVLNTPGYYAILPNYQYDFAPHDTGVVATDKDVNGGNLAVGSQVTVTTANGVLKPGTYTLLPARYALMPGAVLVSSETLSQGQSLARALLNDDGSVVVSGYRTSTGTGLGSGNAGAALVLAPQATVLARTKYELTSINSHLAKQAEAKGTRARSPGNAGRISLGSNAAFDFGANFKLHGGELDLWMGDKMAVVADGVKAPESYAAVDLGAIEATGARSVLLGGQRDGEQGDAQVTAVSTDVLWTTSVNTESELIAVATDRVEVADGLTLSNSLAASDEAQTITLKGPSAALMLTNRIDTTLARRGIDLSAPLSGTLALGKDVTLTGTAVQLDGLKEVALGHGTQWQAQSVGLGARGMLLGADSTDASVLSLTGGLLTSLTSVQRLQLRSYQSIDVAGSLAIGARDDRGQPILQSLVIDAPQVRGVGSASDEVVITARDVVLRNAGGSPVGQDSGAGKLRIVSEPALNDQRTGGTTISGGPQRLAFQNVTLQSKGDVVLDGTGSLNTQGDLTIEAARLTATTAANHALTSGGVLTIAKSEGAHTLGESRGQGATVRLQGQRVVQAGRVELASGKLAVTGTGQHGSDGKLKPDTVVFEDTSVTSTRGLTIQAGKTWAVSTPGGDISVTADAGRVVVRGELDVSSAAKASESDASKSAGTLSLKAIGEQGAVVLASTASLKGSADTATLSGKLVVDTKAVTDDAQAKAAAVAVAAASKGTLDRLADLANAGKVHGGVNLRLREGDQSLGTTLKAVRTVVGVDKGSLTLLGNAVVDARAPQGGVVTLAARDDLVLSTGSQLMADSNRAGANGGDVLLSSFDGKLIQQAGASVSALGDADDRLDGRIVLRAGINAQATDENDPDHSDRVRISLADASLLKAGDVSVEAVQVHDLDEAQAANIKAMAGTIGSQADTFMASAGQIGAALGLDKLGPGAGHVRYGAELRSLGDMALLEEWNLAEMRPGGEPLFLTIRAGGNLNIKEHMSDGFAMAGPTPGSSVNPINPGDAASYRLVAGADTGAANPLAVLDDPAKGSLTIGSGKVVRTTSGSIEMAAAGDVVLEAGTGDTPVQAVAYVAGRLSQLTSSTTTRMTEQEETVEVTTTEYGSSLAGDWVQFTDHGGRMEVHAGRDVTAPGFTQLIGNWLHHAGDSAGAEAWGSALDTFKQGFGSFGGGNIRVEAKGNITNVGVVAPTSARYITTDVATRVTDQSGEETSHDTVSSTRWAVDNGGDVSVKAGGDILGGVYLLSRGTGMIEAGGAISKGTAYNEAKLAAQEAIVGLMGGQWALQARGDLSLGVVYNPTILNNSNQGGTQGLYYTYDSDSALSASSTAGKLVWDESNGSRLVAPSTSKTSSNWHAIYAPSSEKLTFTTTPSTDLWTKVALVAPPTVRLQSLAGDLTMTLGTTVTLFPSASGDLSLFSASDMLLQGTSSDAYLKLANTTPSSWHTVGNPLQKLNATTPLPSEFASSTTLVQTGSDLHVSDGLPARIYAGGDLTFSATANEPKKGAFQLSLSKPAEVLAGGTLDNPLIFVQHFDEQDVSVIQAGKDIQGGIKLLTNISKLEPLGITVAGPGELQVTAGQNLNLNASNGILAIGNARNDQLPEEGAQLRLMAGQAKALQLDAFTAKYIAGSPDAQARLIEHVNEVLNLDSEDPKRVQAYQEAMSLFKAFSTEHQVSFADKVLGEGFVAAYVADGRAYAAAWARAAAKAGVKTTEYDSPAFLRFKDEVLMAEVVRLGRKAVTIADSTDALVNARRKAERNAVWAELADAVSLAGMGEGFTASGNIDLAASTVQTLGKGGKTTGGIDLFVPHGSVIVGLPSNTSTGSGMITYDGGAIRAVLDGDFQVNSQKAFVVGTGDLTVYSINGAIDSGRGSNTTVSVPPTTGKLVDGYMTFQLGAVTSGSGIGILTLPDGQADGNINLFAPVGGILALDTFIRNQAPGDVLVGGPCSGCDNIKAGNVQGAPLVVAAGPALSTPTTLPETAAGTEELANQGRDTAKSRNGILTVDLLGMGDGGAEPTAAGAPAGSASQARDQDCGPAGKACQSQP